MCDRIIQEVIELDKNSSAEDGLTFLELLGIQILEPVEIIKKIVNNIGFMTELDSNFLFLKAFYILSMRHEKLFGD